MQMERVFVYVKMGKALFFLILLVKSLLNFGFSNRYYGKRCERNHCDNFCINGKCKWSGLEATCECKKFYWGKRCEQHCSNLCEEGQCEVKSWEFHDRKLIIT